MRSFQLLWHDVAVEVPDGRVDDALAAVTAFPVQPMSPCRTMHYRVTTAGAGYEIEEEGDHVATVATVDDARDLVHTRAHRRAFELASLMGWVRLHGALVDLPGGRVLITGPSGAGKTTLAARLLVDGADVQGDESILLRPGAAVAVPRPLFVEPTVDVLVPELAERRPHLPRIGDAAVLTPAELGRTWELQVRPVDHVVLLERGEPPVTCEPVSTAVVLPLLTEELFPVTETKPALLQALTSLAGSARCHRLRVGDPRQMAAALEDAVGRS